MKKLNMQDVTVSKMNVLFEAFFFIARIEAGNERYDLKSFN